MAGSMLALAAAAVLAPATAGPDLTSVVPYSTNAYPERQAAAFCFDERLEVSASATSFIVTGYDGNRVLRGREATIDRADDRCVTVAFRPALNLSTQGAVGGVNAGAVRDAGGQTNVFGRAPVSGSSLSPRPGQTTGPDLVAATPDGDRVTFRFDQEIDARTALPSGFGAALADGTELLADGPVEPVGHDAIRVALPAADAVRFFVRADAVRTPLLSFVYAGGALGPRTLWTANPDGAVGEGATPRPVLRGVRLTGASADLTFSAPVSAVDPAEVVAVRDTGATDAAIAAVPVAGEPTRWSVSWLPDGPVARDPQGVVAVVSRTGAALSQDGGAPGPITAVAVGQGAPMRPGSTSGPDLVSAAVDRASRRLRLVFDEAVDPASLGLPRAFGVVNAAGRGLQATQLVGVSEDRRTITVGFSAPLDGATTAVVNGAAVQDRVNHRGPYASVALGERALGPRPRPRPEPRLAIGTRVAADRRGRVISGLVRARRPCRGGRLVVVRRSGRRVGRTRTQASGRFAVRVARGRPVRVEVAVRVVGRTVCRPAVARVG